MALGALAILAVIAVLFAFDPGQYGFYPRCMFKAQTGLDCPGCGGLRAMHQLLHGHVAAAFTLNPLLILSAPFFAAAGLTNRWRRVTGRQGPPRQPRLTWLLLAVVVAFGILRNVTGVSLSAINP